jgi:hypothetical protein
MPNKKATQLTAFAQLQHSYNLSDPQQIKMRILLNLMLAMVESQYGPSTENKRISAGYRKQWKVLECEEGKLRIS